MNNLNSWIKVPERIHAWLGIEPWPLQWLDAMLHPLSFIKPTGEQANFFGVLNSLILFFDLVISMLCKTEWSWELQTWSHKITLLDILSTSPHFFCRKWIGATNDNSNFDLRVKRVKSCMPVDECVDHNSWDLNNNFVFRLYSYHTS